MGRVVAAKARNERRLHQCATKAQSIVRGKRDRELVARMHATATYLQRYFHKLLGGRRFYKLVRAAVAERRAAGSRIKVWLQSVHEARAFAAAVDARQAN